MPAAENRSTDRRARNMRRKQTPPRGLVEVSQVLEGALKKLGVGSDWDRYRLEGKCREWLGPGAARALIGVEEKKGVVTLYFNHSAFLQEMGFRREEGLKVLKDEFPRMGLKEIRTALSIKRTGKA